MAWSTLVRDGAQHIKVFEREVVVGESWIGRFSSAAFLACNTTFVPYLESMNTSANYCISAVAVLMRIWDEHQVGVHP